MLNQNSLFTLYIYPLISSLVAGIVFWFLFSVLPAIKRKRDFSVGIANDFFLINNALFHYFDTFLKHDKYFPSLFQECIHACSITEEEFKYLLQNKMIDNRFDLYPEISNLMIPIKEDIDIYKINVEECIKRLYALSPFLSAYQVQLLRGIQEKLNRYYLSFEPESKIGKEKFRVINTSLSFMANILFELENDYKKIRKIVFSFNGMGKDHSIAKVMYLFYSKKYKQCLRTCNSWICYSHEISLLHLGYKFLTLFKLDRKKTAYRSLQLFLDQTPDIIENREFFYDILSDSRAYQMIEDVAGNSKIEELKEIFEKDMKLKKDILENSKKLMRFFNEKRQLTTAST